MPFIINGEEIPEEVIDQEFAQIKAHYEQMLQVSCCERDDEFRGYAKENILGRVLLNQEAKAATEAPSDEEITATLDRLYEEHGGEDKFYFAMGMPYKDEDIVRENVAQSMRVEQVVGKACDPLPEPSDEELQAHYQEHLDLFKSAEEVRAAHITKNLSGAESRAAVYEQLREIRRRCRKENANFAELAEQENDNKDQEVDLGFFKRGEFMEEFETIAFSMDTEEISPVFTTHLGMHLCQVTDRKAAEAIPFDEAKPSVLEHFLNEYREKKVESYVGELREKAEIVDNDEPGESEPEEPASNIIIQP